MGEQEFIGYLVLGIITLIGGFSALFVPLLKLNSNLTELNSNMKHMKENDSIRDKRIENHGKEIEINTKHITNIENRVGNLEKATDRHEIAIGNLKESLFSRDCK